MINFFSDEDNTAEVNSKRHSLNEQKMTEVNSPGYGQGTPVTAEEGARQIREVTDPLSKQLELCDLIRDARQGPFRRNEATSVLIQRSSRAPKTKSDSEILQSRCQMWYIFILLEGTIILRIINTMSIN